MTETIKKAIDNGEFNSGIFIDLQKLLLLLSLVHNTIQCQSVQKETSTMPNFECYWQLWNMTSKTIQYGKY